MITSLKTIKWDDDCFFNEGKWRWLWSFVLGPMWLNVIAQHVMCREFSLVYLSLLSVSWQQLFIPYSNQWVSLFIGAMFVTTNPFAANNHTAPTHLEFSRLCHQLQLFLGIVCVKILTMFVTTSSGTCGSINTWFFEHRVHTEFFAGRDMGVNAPNSPTVLDIGCSVQGLRQRCWKRTRQCMSDKDG